MSLVRRALGSLPDAAWIRRQFTLDADAVHDAELNSEIPGREPEYLKATLVSQNGDGEPFRRIHGIRKHLRHD